MDSERLLSALAGGQSVLVGAVDATGVPSCCRGIAIASGDGLASATVYVPAATSYDIVANVATTRRIAVVVSHPITHSSLQIKGTTRGVRMPDEEEITFVRTRMDEFAAVLERIGLPRSITQRIACVPAFAIEVDVVEYFDQTPGPRAGEPL